MANGVVVEEFGPALPTVTQRISQMVIDTSKAVDNVTGIPNMGYYIGIALVGYAVYHYMSE